MTIITSFLDEHISLLLGKDENFQLYWSTSSEDQQKEFLNLAKRIDSCACGEQNIVAGHVRASRELARYMVRIQETAFDYSRIPGDWLDFVRSESEKTDIYQQAKTLLHTFIESEKLQSTVTLYGGVKPEASIIRRMISPKTDDQFRQRLLDTWDIIRFRIVAPDLMTTRHVAMRVWERFFGEVVRCRNYYFRPKDDDHSDPYRGIHFELELIEERIVELQVLTMVRELVSILDHAPVFKKSVQLPSVDHQAWLFFFARKANLFDSQSLSRQLDNTSSGSQ
jgi:hypothetical protein